MPDNLQDDVAIIQAAYAERVGDAFKIFAENLGTGQSEASCTLRFRRTLEMVRKARELALKAASGAAGAEPEAGAAAAAGQAAEELSPEDKALIEHALSGTTGHSPAPPPPQRFRTY